MKLILYSKPGCHLCEGLEEKLRQVASPSIDLEVRDITRDPAWFRAYEYEIPVLYWVQELGSVQSGSVQSGSVQSGSVQPVEARLPRISPRASVAQVAQFLQQQLLASENKGK